MLVIDDIIVNIVIIWNTNHNKNKQWWCYTLFLFFVLARKRGEKRKIKKVIVVTFKCWIMAKASSCHLGTTWALCMLVISLVMIIIYNKALINNFKFTFNTLLFFSNSLNTSWIRWTFASILGLLTPILFFATSKMRHQHQASYFSWCFCLVTSLWDFSWFFPLGFVFIFNLMINISLLMSCWPHIIFGLHLIFKVGNSSHV